MNIQDAIDVIESVAGFTDESTPVGDAWAEVLSYVYRPRRPSSALAQPEQVAPTDEPLGDLINAWVQEAFKKKPYGCSHPTHAYVACKAFEYGKNHASARPHPISVSERMPEPEDCDSEGKCWVECPAFVDDGDHGSIAYNPSWELCRCTPSVVYDDTRWLPHYALPTPEATNV